MIGEQFEESDEICGAVVSVRRAQDKIAIWTKTASNEAAQVCNMLYSHTSVTI
jgi:translation initiation factor 4E